MTVLQEVYDIPFFEDAPEEEIQWVLDHGREIDLEKGAFFFQQGDHPNAFYVVLEGELQITRTTDGRDEVMGTTPRGIIGGEIALLLGTPAHISACAIIPSRLLVLEAALFRQLFGACPMLSTRVLKIATERTQGMSVLVKQQEKMAALGKLSAGLAHELNNPAAAARRAASTLAESLPVLQDRAIKLNELGLGSAHIKSLIGSRKYTDACVIHAQPLSPLEQSDREDALIDWFEEQDIPNGWEMAPAFVAAGVSKEKLSELSAQLPAESLPAVLSWLHCSLDTAHLLKEVEQSTRRISDLVGAIKSYTYMDRSGPQEVDIHKGLETTLTVLNHKLKNITVLREYDPDLPCVVARGGELNQIWTNLIDNAIGAMEGSAGTIWLNTRRENAFVMVEVADNGPGIPAEVQPHIFEPFFTTKEVGSGTGLGLDIVYRIVLQHNGTIEVQSQPGHTRFIVRMPLVTASSDG